MQYLGQWQGAIGGVIAELSDSDAVLRSRTLPTWFDLVVELLASLWRRSCSRTFRRASCVWWSRQRRKNSMHVAVGFPAFVDALPVVRIEPLTPRQETNLLDRFLKNDARDRKSTYDSNLADTIRQWCFQFQRHAAAPGPSVEFLKTCLASRPKDLTIDEAARSSFSGRGCSRSF